MHYAKTEFPREIHSAGKDGRKEKINMTSSKVHEIYFGVDENTIGRPERLKVGDRASWRKLIC